MQFHPAAKVQPPWRDSKGCPVIHLFIYYYFLRDFHTFRPEPTCRLSRRRNTLKINILTSSSEFRDTMPSFYIATLIASTTASKVGKSVKAEDLDTDTLLHGVKPGWTFTEGQKRLCPHKGQTRTSILQVLFVILVDFLLNHAHSYRFGFGSGNLHRKGKVVRVLVLCFRCERNKTVRKVAR